MADRELGNALASGELSGIQLGGITTDEKVLTQAEVDSKLASYTKLDGSTPVSKMTWTPVDPATVTYVESTTYYNQDAGTFDVKGKYSDVTLQVGREQHVEVINNSGGNFLNGRVVRYNNVAAGDPAVVLALADSFITSSGLSVTTHNINNSDPGIVTTFGRVGGLDLSAFNDGDVLYLSDTVPGGMTTTPPDIVSRIGIVFDNDAINGVLFVNPESNMQLPTIFAYINDGVSSTTLTAAYTLIANYTTSGNVVMNFNATAGTIDIPTSGTYEIDVNISMLFDTIGNSEESINLRVTGTLSGSRDLPLTIPRNGGAVSAYPGIKFNGIAGESISLSLGGATRTLTNVTYPLVTFEITSVRI